MQRSELPQIYPSNPLLRSSKTTHITTQINLSNTSSNNYRIPTSPTFPSFYINKTLNHFSTTPPHSKSPSFFHLSTTSFHSPKPNRQIHNQIQSCIRLHKTAQNQPGNPTKLPFPTRKTHHFPHKSSTTTNTKISNPILSTQ